MPDFSDIDVMAYADGQLPPERAETLRQQAQHDPQLRARIERYRVSQRLLQRAYNPALAAPVPDRLITLLAEPAAPRRRPQPLWAAAAAVGALALGLGLWQSGGSAPELSDAFLSAALERTPSGETARNDDDQVIPLATLRRDDGVYCRDFEARVGDAPASRHRACRTGEAQWQTVAAAPDAERGYQPAAGPVATTTDWLDDRAEAAAIGQGWAGPP